MLIVKKKEFFLIKTFVDLRNMIINGITFSIDSVYLDTIELEDTKNNDLSKSHIEDKNLSNSSAESIILSGYLVASSFLLSLAKR